MKSCKVMFTLLIVGVLLIVGCTPLKKACAEEGPAITLEVVALEKYGSTQEFVSAFSGMTLIYRHEVDCPDMSVVKVNAATDDDEVRMWGGVKTLVDDMNILYTSDGKQFARVVSDFVAATADYHPMTFVEVCRHIDAGGIIVSDRQHYIRFE